MCWGLGTVLPRWCRRGESADTEGDIDEEGEAAGTTGCPVRATAMRTDRPDLVPNPGQKPFVWIPGGRWAAVEGLGVQPTRPIGQSAWSDSFGEHRHMKLGLLLVTR